MNEQRQSDGWFGEFGGRYVPETLVAALDQLDEAWADARSDPDFERGFRDLLRHYVGRATPLTYAPRLT
ncbi:MAG TPA: tryptophan synthase subunit beta, partial [Phycisphaerales bacterium]|nr:tryptophan synthase subunit beta [Phycisphaerales bacterium]